MLREDLLPSPSRARSRAEADGAVTALFDVVIPTIGRPSLATTLASLAASSGAGPRRVIVVDDRGCPEPAVPEPAAVPARLGDRLTVLRSGGRGPAAARNVGWR